MERLKHSGLGITSFIVSICAGGVLFVLMAIAAVLTNTTPGGLDAKSASAIVLGLLMFLFLFVELVALGLGVAGLFPTGRNKVFAILGIAFSLTSILTVLGLMVIGSLT
jgi:hypothetical protein